MTRKIMISAGEASGDMHAAAFVKELQLSLETYEFYGLGGPQLEALGMELLVDCRDIAVVGIVEVLIRYRYLLSKLKILRQQLHSNPPDLLVLVDYPDFNLKLAETAKKLGIKVLFYISPQVWAWRPKRVTRIGQLVDMMAVLFPFEEVFYKRENIPVRFVGHPLVDEAKSTMSRDEARQLCGINNDKPSIALLPGSRTGEVSRVLPIMIKTAELLHQTSPEINYVLPLAKTLDDRLVDSDIQSSSIKINIVKDHAYDVMNACDALLCASGTATLEAAMIGTPFAITYRVHPLSYFIFKRLVTVPDIGLINVVAGKRIVQEFVQNEAQPPIIVKELNRLLFDQTYRKQMFTELETVKQKMGESGGAANVAELIIEMLDH